MAGSPPPPSSDDLEDVLFVPTPSPGEQMAIVTVLEEEEESAHVYSVSKEWYDRWRHYVGLSPTANCPQSDHRNPKPTHHQPPHHQTPHQQAPHQQAPHHQTPHNQAPHRQSPHNHALDSSKTKGDAARATPLECKTPPGEPRTSPKPPHRSSPKASLGSVPAPPGPVTMDLTDDEGNIYADEKIWRCWVRWFGVCPSHELDRRNWTSDDKDFEICVLSPYCGLIENPVKTFDVSEECGYVELQLRHIFRVARHRSTRLWVCEKARHSRFRPLLDRQRDISSYDCVDSTKGYILALEVANLDGAWPTLVPGEPSGTFDVYRELTEGGTGERAVLWEAGLAETLDTVFGAISNELKETASGIVTTAKCVTAIKEKELDAVKDALRSRIGRCEGEQARVEERARELRHEETTLEQERGKLDAEKEAFQLDRHKFAEEIVRMHTINMIQDTRVRLNIGGHVFMTSTFTLTRDPDSMLAAMFSGRHALKQEDDGSYFLDRDGTHFRYVLNFLRDGNFRSGTLPTDRTFLNELLSEAEYFQIGGLVRLLTDCVKGLVVEGGDSSPEGSGPTSGSGKTFGSVVGPTGYHGRMGPSPQGKRVSRKTSSASQKGTNP